MKKDQPAPKITGFVDGIPQVDRPGPITNYHFVSADNMWKLNLTRNFIALSTLRYTCWEDFAKMLDKPLAQFIKIYQPAFFQRIGLRYLNIISRKKLDLEGTPWSDLIQSPYLGPLAEEDVREQATMKSSIDFEMMLDSSCRAKVHAGPGTLKTTKPGAVQDTEPKFILDIDISMHGNIDIPMSAGSLETLHGHSTRIFRGAITQELHEAML